jgi:hypothetical protein
MIDWRFVPWRDNSLESGDESMKTLVMKALFPAVASVLMLSPVGSAQAWWHNRTVTAYAALPSVPVTTGYAPVVVASPVVTGMPVVTSGYSPVVTSGYSPVVSAGYAPAIPTYAAPVTTYYSAPVTTYYAPAPVTTYYAPAVTTYYAPVRPVIVRRPLLWVP